MNRLRSIDATIESVSLVGFSETTLAKVASIAGLSQGVVVFRFGTKEQLLIETLKFLADEYKEAWSTALGESGSDPVNRLCASGLGAVVDAARAAVVGLGAFAAAQQQHRAQQRHGPACAHEGVADSHRPLPVVGRAAAPLRRPSCAA